MSEPTEASQTTRGFNVIFIHSSIDDAGLTPQQFRVLAHIARRAGDGVSWASNATMAETCRIHPDTLTDCLKALEALAIIVRVARPGKTTVWKINPPNLWTFNQPTPSNHPPASKGEQSPDLKGEHPPESKGDEGNPKKEIKGRKSKAVAFPEIPESLKTPEFEKAWSEWLEDRKFRRKPVTPLAAAKQFEHLVAWGSEKAVVSIRESIEHGWQGLFEPKGFRPTKVKNEPVDYHKNNPWEHLTSK